MFHVQISEVKFKTLTFALGNYAFSKIKMLQGRKHFDNHIAYKGSCFDTAGMFFLSDKMFFFQVLSAKS